MGKGKGKIFGRVLKIKKGEVVFDMGVSHIRKSRKWLGALKLVIPTTTRVVYKSRWVYRRIKDYFRNRAWLSFKRKEKKKKFYQIEAKKFIFMLQAKGESKFLKTIGPESFYRYKTFGFKASKGHTEAMMQIYGLSSSRVASQLSIMDKLHKFGILGAKRNFKSGHSSAGASGGHLRSHLQILYLAKHFTRAFYEQE